MPRKLLIVVAGLVAAVSIVFACLVMSKGCIRMPSIAQSIDRARRWHPNGRRRIYGWQNGDRRVGLWAEYDESGSIMPERSGLYENNAMIRGLTSREAEEMLVGYRADDLWVIAAFIIAHIQSGSMIPDNTSDLVQMQDARSVFIGAKSDILDPWGHPYCIVRNNDRCSVCSFGTSDSGASPSSKKTFVVEIDGQDLRFIEKE